MGEIGVYIASALALGVIAALAVSLSHEKYRGVVGFLMSLLVILPLISPIFSIIGGEFSLPEFEEYLPGAGYIEISERAYVSGAKTALAEEFSIEEENISFSGSDFDFEKMRFGKISVVLSGSAVFADTKGIEKWLTDNFTLSGGKCEVVIDFG